MQQYTFEDIIDRLSCGKVSDTQWRCRCPSTRHKAGDRTPSAILFIGTSGDLMWKCFKGCTAKEVSQAINIPLKFWNKKVFTKERIVPQVKEYLKFPYFDEDGIKRYTVFRQKGAKVIFQQRDVYDHDSGQVLGVTNCLEEGFYVVKSGRLWEKFRGDEVPNNAVEMPQCPKLLYRYPDWQGTKEPIFVVEGEGKVERLFELGFKATCNSGGATHFYPEHAKMLKDHRVIILPDNDEIGREHAAIVAGRLMMAGCPNIRIADLDRFNLPEKGDIADLIARDRGAAEDFLEDLAFEDMAGYRPAWQVISREELINF